jgi:hypothetical protein
LDRPSWAPVVLSGAIPREISDFIAIAVLALTGVQLMLAGPIPFSSLNSSWILILLVPLVCVLAALSNSPNREREELALVAYGGSSRQIELRYVLRGGLITLIGLFPVLLRIISETLSLSSGIFVLVLLVLIGGSTYAIPALKRTHSLNFVEQYKG